MSNLSFPGALLLLVAWPLFMFLKLVHFVLDAVISVVEWLYEVTDA